LGIASFGLFGGFCGCGGFGGSRAGYDEAFPHAHLGFRFLGGCGRLFSWNWLRAHHDVRLGCLGHLLLLFSGSGKRSHLRSSVNIIAVYNCILIKLCRLARRSLAEGRVDSRLDGTNTHSLHGRVGKSEATTRAIEGAGHGPTGSVSVVNDEHVCFRLLGIATSSGLWSIVIRWTH